MDVTNTPEITETSNIHAEPVSREVPVVFSGNAKEFFGIWIVNILLTIVTLGIYAAWAKVRTQQYFYGNTKIEGHAFSYLAQPLQILKGRILAVLLFIGYSLISQFYPLLGIGILFVLALGMPWALNQSLRFNLRMSSYRNVRFSFKGNYGDAFVYWILLPIASIFTLYLITPWVLKKSDEYVYNNISYGDKPLKSDLYTSQYYETVLWIFVASIVFFVAFAAVILIFAGMGMASHLENIEYSSVEVILPIIVAALYILSISVFSAIYKGRIRNHIFNNSTYDGLATFKSDVQIISYSWLIFVNVIAIICTAGLAYPWVKIRTAQFLAQATTVVIDNNADDVLEVMSESQSAFGEEAAEVFDIDIALT